jgi:hypothetical protein
MFSISWKRFDNLSGTSRQEEQIRLEKRRLEIIEQQKQSQQ